MKETLDLLSKSVNYSSSTCPSMAAIIVKDRKFKVAQAVSDTKSPLNHATIMAIEQVAKVQCKAKSSNEKECDEFIHFENDYLCTGYECFLSQDPCIMCAMALVHSRIKRVFVCCDSNLPQCSQCNDRAFQTHKLHILSNLNHHYEVWKLIPVSSITPHDEANSKEHFPNKKIKN